VIKQKSICSFRLCMSGFPHLCLEICSFSPPYQIYSTECRKNILVQGGFLQLPKSVHQTSRPVYLLIVVHVAMNIYLNFCYCATIYS